MICSKKIKYVLVTTKHIRSRNQLALLEIIWRSNPINQTMTIENHKKEPMRHLKSKLIDP